MVALEVLSSIFGMVDHLVPVIVDAVGLSSLNLIVLLVTGTLASTFVEIAVLKFVFAILEVLDLVVLIEVDAAGLVSSTSAVGKVEYVLKVLDVSDFDRDGKVIVEVAVVLDSD